MPLGKLWFSTPLTAHLSVKPVPIVLEPVVRGCWFLSFPLLEDLSPPASLAFRGYGQLMVVCAWVR